MDPGFVALLAALVILPLYPKVGLVAVQGTYIPVRIDDLVMLGVVVAWGATLLLDRRRPRVPSIAPAVVAWLAIGLVALVIGAALLGTISWVTGMLFWAKPVEYLALGWVAYDLVDRPGRLRLVLSVMLAAASAVVIYALFERFGWLPHAPNYATDVSVLRALGSTMGDSHQMATYVGLAALMAVALWHRAGSAVRGVGLVMLAVTAYVLAHAAGRSEFLSLAICMAALAAWRPARLPALAMVLLLAVSFALPSGVEQALDTAFRPTVQPTVQPTQEIPSSGTAPVDNPPRAHPPSPRRRPTQ